MNEPYILCIDGGGTKTLAALRNRATGETWESQGGPSALSLGVEQAKEVIQSLAAALQAQAGASPEELLVIIGVSGGSAMGEKLVDALTLPFSRVYVYSDAITSLYGANLGQPVVSIALGTGSNAATLDSYAEERIIGGWGFPIGDDGGGAKIGWHAVRQLQSELDIHREATSSTAQAIATKVGSQREEILAWLASATATDFADLAPLVLDQFCVCTAAQSIMRIHGQAVDELIIMAGNSELPVVLLGGLADTTRKHLSSFNQQRLIPAKGTALDGAFQLALTKLNQPIS